MVTDPLPRIIQGGMGVGVSSWRLARAVSQGGGLGVVAGTALDVVLARRLQTGDPCGSVRRALAALPLPGAAARILDRWFVPGGKPPTAAFAPTPMPTVEMTRDALELIVAGNFVEVFLAKEGHAGPVGINYLEKIQMPTLPSLHGALLADVDAVLVGAGIPVGIPDVLDRLARAEPARLRIDVAGAAGGEAVHQVFDPRALDPHALPRRRPRFLAIVSSATVARTLVRRAGDGIDGFVVEHHVAGGHNAPPRRAGRSEGGARGFGPADEPDLEVFRGLGVPFWLAGAEATPDALRGATALGAHGVQVGSAFALCDESGMLPEIRREIIARHDAGTLTVRTDFTASPTGYPFKLVELPGTTADEGVRAARRRVCDLGYLREVYAREDGVLGYRCPGEPQAAFAQKGGDVAACEGKNCLCNGLLGTIGLQQVRAGRREPPTVTLGADLGFLDHIPRGPGGAYAARDVLSYLRG